MQELERNWLQPKGSTKNFLFRLPRTTENTPDEMQINTEQILVNIRIEKYKQLYAYFINSWFWHVHFLFWLHCLPTSTQNLAKI